MSEQFRFLSGRGKTMGMLYYLDVVQVRFGMVC